MRSVIFSSVLFLMSLLFSSCLFLGPSVKGDGKVKEKVRDVGDFEGISVTSGMNVYISQGDKCRVVVVADENLHEMIETDVDDGILEIRALANIWKAREKKVVITIPALREITGTAGSNIYTENQITTQNIMIKASAGSNLHLKLDGQVADISASSGANIFMEGSIREVIARVSSGANIKAGDLKTQKSEASASSGGNLWLSAQDELKAHASSGGNIFYFGTPGKTDVTSSSGGNIIKKQ